MKRLKRASVVVVVGCLVALNLMLVAPNAVGQQTTSDQHPRLSDPQKISRGQARRALDYWTPKRMANAKPMEMTSRGGPSAGGSPATERTGLRVESAPLSGRAPLSLFDTVVAGEDYWRYSTTAMPARAIGRLFYRTWNPYRRNFRDSSCTATVVAAENRATVWTAGHCVFNTYSNVWSKKYVFCPGYRDANGIAWEGRDCPMGKWGVKYQQTTPQWKNAVCDPDGRCSNPEFNHDFAALTMYPRNGYRIQRITGSHVIRYNQTLGAHYLFGYPAVLNAWLPFDGRWLYWCWGDNTYEHFHLVMLCHASGGASGGPWLGVWNTQGVAYLDTVNSHGGETHMHASYQGLSAQRLYNKMRYQNPRY